MADGMFGAPAGAMAASEQNMKENAMNLNLAIGGVALKKAQLDLAGQERMAGMLASGFGGQGHGGSPEDTAGMMSQLALYAAKAGLPQEAEQYAKTASALQHNQAYIKTQALTRQMKESGMYANLLGSVHDQQSWQRANALFTVQTGKQMPWARLPYNPRLVQMLKEGALSAKDKALIGAAHAREQAQQQMIKMEQERIDLMKSQKKLTDQRRAKLGKVGGDKPIPAANLQAITDLMVRDYGQQVPVQTMRTLARPVAERMQEILRQSPGLEPSAAAERAYQEAKAEGDFGGLRVMRPQMGTKENAIPLPQDKSKWEPNRYYKLPNGQVALFDGKQFIASDETGGL